MATEIRLNGKKMTSYKIREKRKQGWDTKEFAKFFGVTEESVLKTLRKKLGDQYLSLNLTEPVGFSSSRVESNVPVAAIAVVQIAYDSVKEMSLEETMERDVVKAVEMVKSISADPETELENKIASLRAEGEALSEKFAENESAISAKNEEFEAVQKRLQEIFDEVTKLRGEQSNIESAISELNQNSEEILEQIAKNENDMAIAEAELLEYRTVEIYYDEEGLHTSRPLEVSKEAVMSKCLEFLAEDEYEMCPSKALKGIASIHVAISTLEAEGAKYDVALEKCTEDIRNFISE